MLQKLDAVNLLGREAMAIGSPLLAALVICMIAALVSAFASTTGVLAALAPMAVPLLRPAGSRAGRSSPRSAFRPPLWTRRRSRTPGATLIASAPEEDRPRLRVMLLRWSMAMVVVGPLVTLPLLVLFGR